MKTRGINRVAIIVKDFDAAVALYSKLLNTTFYPIPLGEEYGSRVAFSYEPGIEIASPIPGSSHPMALAEMQYLKEHGEGLRAVIFDVDDVEQARDNAEKMGVQVLQKLEVDRDEIKRTFQDRWRTYIEYLLNPEDTHGAFVILGQFTPKTSQD